MWINILISLPLSSALIILPHNANRQGTQRGDVPRHRIPIIRFRPNRRRAYRQCTGCNLIIFPNQTTERLTLLYRWAHDILISSGNSEKRQKELGENFCESIDLLEPDTLTLPMACRQKQRKKFSNATWYLLCLHFFIRMFNWASIWQLSLSSHNRFASSRKKISLKQFFSILFSTFAQVTAPTIWIWRFATVESRWRWDWRTASKKCTSSRLAWDSTIISGIGWQFIEEFRKFPQSRASVGWVVKKLARNFNEKTLNSNFLPSLDSSWWWWMRFTRIIRISRASSPSCRPRRCTWAVQWIQGLCSGHEFTTTSSVAWGKSNSLPIRWDWISSIWHEPDRNWFRWWDVSTTTVRQVIRKIPSHSPLETRTWCCRLGRFPSRAKSRSSSAQMSPTDWLSWALEPDHQGWGMLKIEGRPGKSHSLIYFVHSRTCLPWNCWMGTSTSTWISAREQRKCERRVDALTTAFGTSSLCGEVAETAKSESMGSIMSLRRPAIQRNWNLIARCTSEASARPTHQWMSRPRCGQERFARATSAACGILCWAESRSTLRLMPVSKIQRQLSLRVTFRPSSACPTPVRTEASALKAGIDHCATAREHSTRDQRAVESRRRLPSTDRSIWPFGQVVIREWERKQKNSFCASKLLDRPDFSS